ncbi:MAG: deoxyribose-phosphate aldolase [Flavobacteriia bacterium]|nr:deoxyribose-phosphate aldolase [Flavobacteriia bacterium]
MLENSILQKIDYTLLDHTATEEIIVDLCKKAKELKVKSVCIMPKHVAIAKRELHDSEILVCTVISFPEGTNSLAKKEQETHVAIRDGADEIDLVMDYSRIENLAYIKKELKAIEIIAHSSLNKLKEPILIKVIVESGRLSIDETKVATKLCIQAGVDFIKTSTGKVEVGAEIAKVQEMKSEIVSANSTLKIKASGGIRTIENINEFNDLVDRFGIGYQSVDQMVEGKKGKSREY